MPTGAVVQLVLPVPVLKLPVEHKVALLAPDVLTNLPAGAGVQLLRPVLPAKEPAEQAVWAV